MYNNGEGEWIHCAHLACLRNRDRAKSKQFDVIKALGDAAFDFKFEGSDLLSELTKDYSRETHPHMYTKHCWNIENRWVASSTINKIIKLNKIK